MLLATGWDSIVIHRFGPFHLDPARAELRGPEGVVPLEPKAYDLLLQLLEAGGRVVTKDEMVARLWGGRAITDAALSTLVKTLRHALGDDGDRQAIVQTVRGRGFRLGSALAPASPAPADPPAQAPPSRPKLAVLPFRALGSGVALLADAVPADLIAALSQHRWLQVIARESSFRFRDRDPDPETILSRLGAGYALSGSVEALDRSVALSLELLDTRSGAVVWAERLSLPAEELPAARPHLAARVAAELDLRIPANEAAQARSRPAASLDAWGHYHLGLQRMFRFNAADNAAAADLLARATELDPLLAGAFAARSFTSYQEAAMGWGDRAAALRSASEHAERAYELDPLDPAASAALGRYRLLLGEPGDAAAWLDRAIALGPSYAKGHYARGLAAMFAGRPGDIHPRVDEAMALSPLDPLLCAMQSTKAVAFALEGRLAEAADWAVRGARAPHAHFAIRASAAALCQAAGDADEARRWRATLLAQKPDFTVGLYFAALPYTDAALRARFTEALLALGLPE